MESYFVKTNADNFPAVNIEFTLINACNKLIDEPTILLAETFFCIGPTKIWMMFDILALAIATVCI